MDSGIGGSDGEVGAGGCFGAVLCMCPAARGKVGSRMGRGARSRVRDDSTLRTNLWCPAHWVRGRPVGSLLPLRWCFGVVGCARKFGIAEMEDAYQLSAGTTPEAEV